MYDLEWDYEEVPQTKKITSRQKSMAKQQEQFTGKPVDPLKVTRRKQKQQEDDDSI